MAVEEQDVCATDGVAGSVAIADVEDSVRAGSEVDDRGMVEVEGDIDAGEGGAGAGDAPDFLGFGAGDG